MTCDGERPEGGHWDGDDRKNCDDDPFGVVNTARGLQPWEVLEPEFRMCVFLNFDGSVFFDSGRSAT